MGPREPVAGTLLAVTLALGGCTGGQGAAPAVASPAEGATQQVTVTGIGRTTTTPDTLLATLGVEVTEQDLSEAFTGAAEAAERVLAELQERGVAEEDIRTVDFSVRPVRGEPPEPPAPPEVTGYAVSNTLDVTIRDVDAAGQVLAAVVDAAGDAARVQGVRYSVEEDAEHLRAARDAAFEDARAKAEQYAELAGRELGELLVISESGGVTTPRGQAFDTARAVPESVPPLEPGQQTLDATVHVTWELQ